VASTSRATVKSRLREELAARPPAAITGAVWEELLKTLAPVSESYLRELLRETGIPFEQPYAGIRQHTFEELEESLAAMGAAYESAVAAEDRVTARYCRRQVIQAKDRAKKAAGRANAQPDLIARKREMAQWMLVWLETPEVFPAWAHARKRALESQNAPSPEAGTP
jgi:hypothetical protein